MIKVSDLKPGVKIAYEVYGIADKKTVTVGVTSNKRLTFFDEDGNNYDDDSKTFVSNVNFHKGIIVQQ